MEEGINIPTSKIVITGPTIVTPTSVKNEHTMQPCGCEAGHFKAKNCPVDGDYVDTIVLTTRSEDGKTFYYNPDISVEPSMGNYVFQKYATKRSWITSVDTGSHKITFDRAVLQEGTGVYSKGFYVDFQIPNWKPSMSLWGVTVTALERSDDGKVVVDPCVDFIELSVVDWDDLLKMDVVCQALFGVDAADATPYILAAGFENIGEFGGHWVKYYDESWLMNINGKYTQSPDGAPGELMAGLYLHFSFFSTQDESNSHFLYLDYYLTAKDPA